MANAVNAVIDGVGQLTYGLTWAPTNLNDGLYSISGLGVVTYGFLWLRNDIWVDTNPCYPAVWTDDACNTVCD